jgi:hypothetical protein
MKSEEEDERANAVFWSNRGDRGKGPNQKFQVPSTKFQVPSTKSQETDADASRAKSEEEDERADAVFWSNRGDRGKGRNPKVEITSSKYQVSSTKFQVPNPKEPAGKRPNSN